MHYYLFPVAATKGRLKEHRGVAIGPCDMLCDGYSYWAIVCAMRWRIGDEGIAFLFLLRACCHDIAAAMALVVAELAPGPMPGRYRAERSYLLLRTALYLSFLTYLSIYLSTIPYTLYIIHSSTTQR